LHSDQAVKAHHAAAVTAFSPYNLIASSIAVSLSALLCPPSREHSLNAMSLSSVLPVIHSPSKAFQEAFGAVSLGKAVDNETLIVDKEGMVESPAPKFLG
jgi:hypothetical protein